MSILKIIFIVICLIVPGGLVILMLNHCLEKAIAPRERKYPQWQYQKEKNNAHNS